MNTYSSLTKIQTKESPILCISLNQDQGCFAVGLETGFNVYNTDPMDLRVKRSFGNNMSLNGQKGGTGIGLVKMLHRTNYLALVGGGKSPKYANNKLIIWDDLKRKCSLSVDFMSPILNVLLSRIRIVVVLRNQVLVFGFSAPPKKFAVYETIDNEYGLADLSVNSNLPPINYLEDSYSTASSISSLSSSNERTKFQILAFPARSVGQIQVVDVSPQGQEKNLVSIIKAHKSKIRCLTLNRTGKMVASASETGTIIRVHSTHNTALLFEFRRGLDRAVITSMRFSHDDSKLAVLSDKNTLHIFNISLVSESLGITSERISPKSSPPPPNRKHLLKKLSLPIPIPEYFNSTWSFCSINMNKYHNGYLNGEEDNTDLGVLGWSGNDTVIVIWHKKRIWEKYLIHEKESSKKDTSSEINHNNQWEIIRTSWKSIDEVN